ncbi:MAG: hypothetical protein SVU32_06335, partial [Candidatus Nanohaloarchaea archaeon]|nr:hypothetical protein [Candidatus Nanohaloarchaea archaeon]
GRNAKDSVLVEPVLNDLDASYHGCSNGWERYTIHNQQPASIQEEDELYRLAEDYRREAIAARRDSPSFGNWLADQQ